MKDLPVYLNDHLAGSVGALEMLDDMIDSHEGKPIESFLKGLRNDIEADQNELKQFLARLDVKESTVRKAGAWMMEKVSRAKLRSGDSSEPDLALLQSLEGLSLGITGKRSLWRTLAAASESWQQPREIDFARLEARALEQFERVEAQALEIGRELFRLELHAPDA